MAVQNHLKIAVTGASGFIGRHVLAELALHPVAIVAVTRSAARLADAGAAVRVVEMNIAQVDAGAYDRLGRPDVLIHLAWDGLPNYGSLHHFETELPRQYRFLKSMIEAGLPALLVTGTCFEYGMQSGVLLEDLTPLPGNPYGYAKDALRRQVGFLCATHPCAFIWTRLFYMYGDGQPRNSLLPQLQEAIARGDKVFNMSGGEQLRDYLPVREVARFVVKLALHHCGSTIVNICAGQPISVRRLVESWIQQNDWKITLNLGYYPYLDHEPMAFWGDRRRLDTILG
ncbi:MAG TPA: NAD-dependent epimerase/dehydratase family protein [Candidatus Competibacteraceae bacterium]|nr:NAD-dependent epimerase/dehydratase family protein [Candidatus Contendobacter sp.]HRD49121.1 NAD-dependent epimerase/dehydratase family protein [Candidatus Contendobacter sp.]HRF45054.1 NAD-dependent epimerase/dehydratase family protein [Candidatus Competibacteraceae bacterium]